MIHRRRNPGRRVVTIVTGARRHSALVARRDASCQRVVVTGGAGRHRHYRVVHRRRFPPGRTVTAVAGDGGVRPALVVRRNP